MWSWWTSKENGNGASSVDRTWGGLASGADVEALLEGRDCAALSLFDCPVIVARAEEGLELWLQSSYAQFLDERLARE